MSFPLSLIDFLKSPLQKLHEVSHPPIVFCDFDGPIVDVSERYYRTYQLGLSTLKATYQAQHNRELLTAPLSKQQFWWMKQNRVADREIAARSGLAEDVIDTFLQQVSRLVNHPHLLRWDRLQPDADEAIAQIKRCGARLVMVTLRHPRQVQSFLQAHDLSQHIDQIFGAADIQAAHLNRVEQKVDLLKSAIASQQAQGFSTKQTWMIGDTEADVIAGQTAEIQTVALTCGVRSQSYLERLNPNEVHPTLLSAIQRILIDGLLQQFNPSPEAGYIFPTSA
ncbi:MAG: HAD hydrolase-like protein [Cyanobacteria bacterium P01_A01_bin.114]